jgi:hypothetical protein
MHMRVHDAVEAEFVCCKCDRAYQHLRSLLLHQRKKHADEEGVLPPALEMESHPDEEDVS